MALTVSSAKMGFQLKRRRAGTLSELVDSALLTAETIFFLVAPIENKGVFFITHLQNFRQLNRGVRLWHRNNATLTHAGFFFFFQLGGPHCVISRKVRQSLKLLFHYLFCRLRHPRAMNVSE